MGREAKCRATLDGRGGEVNAHLDSAVVRVRGALRLDVAFADARDLDALDGELRFRAPEGDVRLALGQAEALKWLKGIREPKSLIDKFGIKAGMRVCVRGVDDPAFLDDLTARLEAQPLKALRGRFDAIVAGVADAGALATLAKLRASLEPAGMLWIVAPKGKNSPVPESALRAALLRAGLVDVKVAAFSPTHTAVKAVIPVAQRV